MKTAVKICGIKTPEMARFCADNGAAFVGIVLHPASPRYVDLNTAVSIATAAQQAGIIPVPVFVDADENEILNFCTIAGVNHVQLHGDKARQALPKLPAHIHKIYAVANRADCEISSDDYLLFDSHNPGAGEVIDWANINPPENIRFFLAGGLNAQNVKQAINITQPFAVDVSSGVESSLGEKSKDMIVEFINEVHNV
ncbi:MAG: phosphoribosylanthranilate isomerase [Gammaproteobacteria bacterium]|jgi:phosphoribosylanthranilate isomerase